eukprot:jgi/Phyca11/111113/e_gw1.19.430.1
MNFKSFVAILVATVITTSVPITGQQRLCGVSPCVTGASTWNIRLSNCCASKGGDFNACCATSCQFGNPCTGA